MSNSLLNPIQAEEVGVRVDTRQKRYYPNEVRCQSLHFPDGTIIPVLYEGVLPIYLFDIQQNKKSTTVNG